MMAYLLVRTIHISAVETALGLAASPLQHFDSQRYRRFFDDEDCLVSLGRGLASSYASLFASGGC